MSKPTQRKPEHPGAAFAGFALPLVLLVSVVVGFKSGFLWDLGFRGGEFAYMFIGVVIGAILVGCVLRLAHPRSPWRSIGSGLIVGGTVGVGVIIGMIVLLWMIFSQSN